MLRHTKKYIYDIIACIVIGISVLFLFSGKWMAALDGDYNAYSFGVNFSEVGRALSNGELFLWNPNIWGGISGIHNFTSPFYPITLLLSKIFYDPVSGLISYYAALWNVVFYALICMLGYYFLCREVKLDVMPALCAVLLGMPVLSSVEGPLCWIPWFFLFIIKSVKYDRIVNVPLLFAGLSWGMFCLENLAQGAVEGLLLIGLLWLVWMFAEMIHHQKGTLHNMIGITTRFALAGIIGLGIAAINLLPVLEQSPDLLRVVSTGFLESNTGVDIASFYADTASLDDIRALFNNYLYSMLTIVFVILGLFSKRTYKSDGKYVLMNYGKGLLLFSVFASTSIIIVDYLYYIPFINRLRETYLYRAFFPLAFTVLTAYGVETLFLRLKKQKDVIYNPYLAYVMCALLLVHDLLLPVQRTQRGLFSALALLCMIDVLILTAKKCKENCFKRIAFMLILCICIINVYYVQRINFTLLYTTAEAEAKGIEVSDAYKKLYFPKGESNINNPYRIMTWGGVEKFSADSAANIGGMYTQGYWEPIYHKTLEIHWNKRLVKSLTLDNVKYFVISENEPEEYLNWIKTVLLDEHFVLYDKVEDVYPNYDAAETQNLLIYKNKHYVGEAWMCYGYEKYTDETTVEELMSRIEQDDFDPANKVLVNVSDQGVTALLDTITQNDGDYQVSVEKYTNNKIALQCSTSENGILVLAESDAPGWKAMVDGQKTDILECDYDRKGIYLEKGTHLIELEYKPDGFILGRFITVCTMLGVLTAIIIIAVRTKQMNDREVN